MCSDTYLFATPNDFHFADFFFHGKHEIYFKNLSITSMQIMEEYGLRVFRFCDKIAHLMRKNFSKNHIFVADVLMTQYLFFAKPEGMLTKANVPPSEEQEKDNIKFIKEASGFEFKLRNTEIGFHSNKQTLFIYKLKKRYNDGISLVCSCFVIGAYKAAGMFDGLDIQITEFTPKDVIQLKFWDFDFESKLILIYLIVNQWEQYKCISQT